MAKPVITATMKKLLLAVLAVAAVALVAVVVVVVNTPERRMDRRERRMDRKLDKLLRSYEDDPKQLCKRLVDDRDLLGVVLVNSFLWCKGLERCGCDAITTSDSSGLFLTHEVDCDYRTYLTQHLELFDDFWSQIGAELCDCETAPSPPSLFQISGNYPVFFSVDLEVVFSGHREVVFSGHPEHCNWDRALQDMRKTWTPYILRKTKEFCEAWLNR